MGPDATYAKKLGLLFHYGVAAPAEIILWADSQIAELDEPPTDLIELSSTPLLNTGDIITYLGRLGAGSDFWSAFRGVLARLYEHVLSRPADAEQIADQLFRTVCVDVPTLVPQEFKFIYHFGDAFYLARAGIYRDSEAVYRDFLSELQQFAIVLDCDRL